MPPSPGAPRTRNTFTIPGPSRCSARSGASVPVCLRITLLARPSPLALLCLTPTHPTLRASRVSFPPPPCHAHARTKTAPVPCGWCSRFIRRWNNALSTRCSAISSVPVFGRKLSPRLGATPRMFKSPGRCISPDLLTACSVAPLNGWMVGACGWLWRDVFLLCFTKLVPVRSTVFVATGSVVCPSNAHVRGSFPHMCIP